MALTWEQTKALMRFQEVAEELSRVADMGRTGLASDHVNARLDPVIEQIAELLDAADPALAAEFRRTLGITEGRTSRGPAVPRAAALHGWIKGAIAAETWEMRTRAEAQAYAEARVQKERGVGFKP